MGGMFGKGGGETTKKPLPEQYDQLKHMWAESGRAYDRPQQYYGESTVAGRSDISGQATRMAGELGGTSQAASGYLQDVLGGEFMGGPGQNPMLDERFALMSDRIGQQFNRITAPSTATRFAGAGRMGSAAYGKAMNINEQNLGDTLSSAATNVYYQDYENRTQDRMRALGMAPGVAGIEYGDIAQTRAAGNVEDSFMQRQLDDSVNRFNFAQNEPEARLDRFSGRVGQNLGFGTQTTPQKPGGGGSLIASLLGMVMTGGASGLLGGLMGGGGGGGQTGVPMDTSWGSSYA